MSNIKIDTIEDEIAEHYIKISQLKEKKKKLQESQFYNCPKCKKKSKYKEVDYVQHYWYEYPWGCEGGDNWHKDHISLICPKCGEFKKVYKTTDKSFWTKCKDMYYTDVFNQCWKKQGKYEMEQDIGQTII